jgi:hypothetical protein
MDLLKELEATRKDRANDPSVASEPDKEQKHDMGEVSTTSPVGSK